MGEIIRCGWAEHTDIERHYHDTEWGRPLHDEQKLFEFLVLDGQQAGLSWVTILRKREALRAAFAGFDPERLARFGEADFARLLENPAIIRNRLKIRSAAENARAYLRLREECGGLDPFLWRYVDGTPVDNHPKELSDIPATSLLSDTISRDLKKLGFTFVGSTIVYAVLQSAGIVNDHLEGCFVRREMEGRALSKTAADFQAV